jgi:hypothetical protein
MPGFSADRGNQPFGLGQRQAADAVDLLGDEDLARLQVSNQAWVNFSEQSSGGLHRQIGLDCDAQGTSHEVNL